MKICKFLGDLNTLYHGITDSIVEIEIVDVLVVQEFILISVVVYCKIYFDFVSSFEHRGTCGDETRQNGSIKSVVTSQA